MIDLYTLLAGITFILSIGIGAVILSRLNLSWVQNLGLSVLIAIYSAVVAIVWPISLVLILAVAGMMTLIRLAKKIRGT